MPVLTSNCMRLDLRLGLRLGLACILLAGSLAARAQGADPLNADERAWLADHPRIRVAPDPDYPPLEFFDDQNRYQGIAADTLNLLSKKLGIDFEIVHADSWDAVLEMAKARQIDMLSAAV